MINRLKLAIVDEDFDELEKLADELENAIENNWLSSLTNSELIELKALYSEALKLLKILRKKDLEKIKKLKNTINYIK